MVFPAGAGPGADYRREVRQPAQTKPFYPGAPLSPPNVTATGLRFEYDRFWAAYRSWLAAAGAANVLEPAPSVPRLPINVGPYFFTGGADPTGAQYTPPPPLRAYESWLAVRADDPVRARRVGPGAPSVAPYFFTGGADPTGVPFRTDQTIAAYRSWSRLPGPGRTMRHELRVPPGTAFGGPFPFTGGADPTGAPYTPAGALWAFLSWLATPGPGGIFRPAQTPGQTPATAAYTAVAAVVPYVAPGGTVLAQLIAWLRTPGPGGTLAPEARTSPAAPNAAAYFFTGGADPTGAVYLPPGVALPFAAWLLLPGPGATWRPQERRWTEPYAAGPGAWTPPPGDPTGAVYLPAGVRLAFAAWALTDGAGAVFRPAGAVPPGTAVPAWLAGAPAPVVVLVTLGLVFGGGASGGLPGADFADSVFEIATFETRDGSGAWGGGQPGGYSGAVFADSVFEIATFETGDGSGAWGGGASGGLTGADFADAVFEIAVFETQGGASATGAGAPAGMVRGGGSRG